jgi:cysteine synthase A
LAPDSFPKYTNRDISPKLSVEDESAILTARRLATEEGILVGISAGANLFAALQIAKRNHIIV